MSGVTKQMAFAESISKFSGKDMEAAALAKGYSKGELPKLASAVNLYAQAKGCSETEALDAVAAPGSKANRLMNYGGRFMQSVDNFRNGLRLMDAFDTWFDNTQASLATIHKGFQKNYTDGLSMTLYNAIEAGFNPDYKRGMEMFAFEELAYNPSISLAETDINKVFGMEHNPATSCLGRHYSEGRAQTLAQIPPEKRTLFFKALTMFCPLSASNAEQAKTLLRDRNIILDSQINYVIARVLKNFDQIASLQEKGKLNTASLAKLCFPEIKKIGSAPINDVIKLLNQWQTDISGDYARDIESKYSFQHSQAIVDIMSSSGCSIEEAYDAVVNGKQLPHVPYYSSGTLNLASFDGTTTEARKGLAADLNRPEGYSHKDGSGEPLLKTAPGFTFNFPGGTSLVTNSSEQGKANIPKVMDKLEGLCGKSHPRQASSLLMMTSQSGLAMLRGGLASYGIDSNEHSAVDFTISKNDETGNVTIRYSSPKELPFSFEWTATIKPDGHVTTTPLVFLDEQEIADRNQLDGLQVGQLQDGLVIFNP